MIIKVRLPTLYTLDISYWAILQIKLAVTLQHYSSKILSSFSDCKQEVIFCHCHFHKNKQPSFGNSIYRQATVRHSPCSSSWGSCSNTKLHICYAIQALLFDWWFSLWGHPSVQVSWLCCSTVEFLSTLGSPIPHANPPQDCWSSLQCLGVSFNLYSCFLEPLRRQLC